MISMLLISKRANCLDESDITSYNDFPTRYVVQAIGFCTRLISNMNHPSGGGVQFSTFIIVFVDKCFTAEYPQEINIIAVSSVISRTRVPGIMRGVINRRRW